MTTIDTGDELFNSDIWDVPIKKPDSHFLGISGVYINPEQIPFDYTTLEYGDMIENEFKDRLFYDHGRYVLSTDDCTRYLNNWFCKWKKI